MKTKTILSKKINLILLAVILTSMLASCGHSPYKKRKGCRGNGSWYGHRNLGYTVPFPKEKENNKKTYYAKLPVKEQTAF